MVKGIAPFRFGILISASLLAAQLAAQDATHSANQLTAQEKRAGWKLLFDGKTTQGWKGFKKAEFPSHRWVVENECLLRRAGGTERDPITGGGGNDIITTEKFRDFELQWEWRIAPGGNSGLKYFISEDRIGAIGHEYQLIDDARHPDAQHGAKRMTAALYDVLSPQNTHVKPAGEFNKSRILVQGNHVEHWLNGTRVLQYELGSGELKAGIADSKFKDVSGYGTKFDTPILLQDHGNEICFRNIKIRSLGPGLQN